MTLPPKEAERFLNSTKIVTARYEKLAQEKLERDESIWDTIKKGKASTFISNSTIVEAIVNNLDMEIKEEKKLIERLLVTSRIGPDIDLPKFLETFKFPIIPPSHFKLNGLLDYPKDKWLNANKLQKLELINENWGSEDFSSVVLIKVVAIDGMTEVNKIDIKKSQICNTKQFASLSISKIDGQASQFNEVRV